MSSLVATIHSFVIRVWMEETTDEAGRPVWRGHITHYPGGERRYLGSVRDITAFVDRFLDGMGSRSGPLQYLRRLLNR